jgi:hypothetical protein
MNNSKTPKIVVGAGLAAVYTAVAFFALRGTHDNAVAQSLPAPVPAPIAGGPASSPLAVPPSADTLASADARTPESIPAAATPAASAPQAINAAKAPEAARPKVAAKPNPRAAEVPVASLASTPPPPRSDAAESSPDNSGSNAIDGLAPTANTVASGSATTADGASQDKEGQTPAEVSALPDNN